MNKRIIAITGSYRRGGIAEQAVEIVLNAAQQEGAQTELVSLLDKHVEFCTNCRICSRENPTAKRGPCVLKDDMVPLLDKIDAADGIILAAPINCFTVTALMKRFIERTIVYAYWPWEQHMPKLRSKDKKKKAVIITASACPAVVGRILMPNALSVLKCSVEMMGAKVVKSIYLGGVCLAENQKLNRRQIQIAKAAGRLL